MSLIRLESFRLFIALIFGNFLIFFDCWHFSVNFDDLVGFLESSFEPFRSWESRFL